MYLLKKNHPDLTRYADLFHTMVGRGRDVTDEEILDVFRDHPDSMLSTGEVAEHLTIGQKGTRERLHALATKGELEFKHFGNQIIWSLPIAEE